MSTLIRPPRSDSAPHRIRFFVLSRAIIAGLVVALSYSDKLSGRLGYDRAAIVKGEIWRVATGSFVHWSHAQAVWCVLALVVLFTACEMRDRGITYMVTLASAIGITLAIFLYRRDIENFRGLSGIDSALYGLLTVLLLKNRQAKPPPVFIALTALLVLAGKLCWELWFHRALFAGSEGNLVPLPLAHALGMLIGLGGGYIGTLLRSRHDRYASAIVGSVPR